MKFELGKLYKIHFWDHCVGLEKPIQFECVGWVLTQDDISVTTTHWMIDGEEEDMDLINGSYEYSCILKSTIISKELL